MLATVHNDIPRNYDLSDFRIVSLFSSYALTLLDGHCWDALVYSKLYGLICTTAGYLSQIEH